MKFLEGKTPAERNKTIAALVLGFLAIVALAYAFLFSGSSKPRVANTNQNSNQRPVLAGSNSNSNVSTAQIQTPGEARDNDPFADLGPIPDNPFPPVYGDAPARNIFAFYEPPPPAPKPIPTATPIPQPSPPPPPPITVQYVNPQAVYARQGDFAMEVGGDKFTPDTKIYLNGMEVPTQFQSAQRLTAQVSAALIAQPGQANVQARAANGDQSNPMTFNVQAPPVPNYSFVGLVARKRFNNDTAMLQEKSSKAYQNVRLGETVGRFKVVSISSNEVVMQDTQLNFRHSLAFVRENSAGASSSASGAGRSNNPNNGFPPGFDPNPQVQYQSIPGIPGQYVQPQIQPMPQPSRSNNDDDDGDNR